MNEPKVLSIKPGSPGLGLAGVDVHQAGMVLFVNTENYIIRWLDIKTKTAKYIITSGIYKNKHDCGNRRNEGPITPSLKVRGLLLANPKPFCH